MAMTQIATMATAIARLTGLPAASLAFAREEAITSAGISRRTSARPRGTHGSRIPGVEHQELDTGLREIGQVLGGSLPLGRAECRLDGADRVEAQQAHRQWATVKRCPAWAGFSSSSTIATAKSSALIASPIGLSVPTR